jgi:large subunit ribosomal protein L9
MKQQLLLIKDVDSLGRSGDVVSVKPGFARNFLLPQKKAVIAQKHTLRMQEKLKEERAKQAAVDKKDAEEMAKRVDGKQLTIEVKVDPEANMYGSVAAAEIVALFEKEGIAIERKFVQLPRPIRELGDYTVALKLKEGVPASFQLKVLGEGGIEKKKPKPVEADPKTDKKEMLAEAEKLADEAKE